MKKDIHPKYEKVLFVDSSTGHKFVCGSCGHTTKASEREVFQGVEYPVYRVSISSASHPLFTGSKQFVDAEGRVDKFRKRYAAKSAQMKGDQEKEQEKEQQKEQPAKPSAKKKPAAKK